ncbi:MAG TPA: hypothetical protein VF597_01630 [Candidatus Saccharimonadales bacterium]|jgi:hypothetical protein
MGYVPKYQNILQVLTPSWYGGLFTALVSAGAVAAAVVPKLYAGSWVAIYLNTDQFDASVNQTNFDEISRAVNTSNFVADASIFVLWAITGLALFFVVSSIARSLHNTFVVVELFDFFRRDRKAIEREAIAHTALRLVALLGIYGLYQIAIHYILPYCLMAGQVAASEPLPQQLGYLVLLFFVIALTLHLFLILVRLVMLRPRLFQSAY